MLRSKDCCLDRNKNFNSFSSFFCSFNVFLGSFRRSLYFFTSALRSFQTFVFFLCESRRSCEFLTPV
ncbi:hypothetical protein 2200_scaffold1335_00065 [Bacteriophage sp.]|nr:hypothetical protein 2200_scaffold1335_00065 [Bacteriophage sp.]